MGRSVMEQTKNSTMETTEETENRLRPKSPGSFSTKSAKYKSNISLHELGLDNYPYPEMPEASRLTRKEEKMSLQNLNNRLTKQIKHIEEYQSKEVTNVKQIYDNEIDSLKEEVRDLSNKLGGLENERKKTQERLDEVLPEVQKMQDKLAEAKKLLDDEVLKKADLENHCQRLDEELKFKIQLLSQQLDEVKTRKEIEITEMDGKLQEEYEDRLQKALNELRDVYDKQMAQNREDFGKLYESRVNELQTSLSDERGKASSSEQALK